MVTEFYLMIWIVTAIHGSQYGNVYESRYAWNNTGLFTTEAACHNAAKQLSVDPKNYRCIPKQLPR